MKKTTPTMQDVAKAAGVSAATVCRALTLPKKTSAGTRQKVEQAVVKIGYCHRYQATSTLRLLLVIIADLNNSTYTEIIQGMESAALEQNYKLLLISFSYIQHLQPEFIIHYVMSYQADGILILNDPTLLALTQKYHSTLPPIIIVNGFTTDLNLSCVHTDNLTMAFDAVNYLQQQGHRHIASVGGATNSIMEQGYIHALNRHNLVINKQYIINSNMSVESGIKSLSRLMELVQPPSAIFCHNDQLALGILYQAKVLGLKIPDNLSIICIGDNKLTKYSTPPITCINQPFNLMGRQAIEKIIKKIKSGPLRVDSLLLDYQLIIRHSVCKK